MPGLHIGEARKLLLRRNPDGTIQPVVPRYPCEVGVCHFIAHKPLLALQPAVEDAENAPDLLVVALNSRGELLRVEDVEPVLTVVS